MKLRIFLILILFPFLVNAQKSSYINKRLTGDVSFTRMNYSLVPEYKQVEKGISVSLNYGFTKFLETGVYYNRYFKSSFVSLNFVGIQNRFHILPFFIESNNRFFRADAYVLNQTGLFLYRATNSGFSNYFYTNLGAGLSLFIFKNLGLNFDYTWSFVFSKNVVKSNFQNGFKLGLILKF
ncbi:MAG: hypothetical protein M0Q45_08585 [Bacteroidales bacterium]|jgi:hypothetical protein|nr:hypothetical protein [Bacteroidales bacterium]MCK9499548.1 hypothetical protein [Bacteroidales bacterium]MDY0316058.1 hypothetical protein [Bacteroidales bacterium]